SQGPAARRHRAAQRRPPPPDRAPRRPPGPGLRRGGSPAVAGVDGPPGRLLPHPGRDRAARPRGPRRAAVMSESKYLLKLYVTGQTPRSLSAIANLRRICEEELHGSYEMVVIDVLERPQLAEDEKILATPTVVKELPTPIRRIIGDLSDSEKVLLG